MRKVAIVEDVEDNRDFLYFILQDRYQVTRCDSGRRALQEFRTDPPDLVLLDLSLPDIDGFEVLRILRKDPDLKAIPIIAVTAHAMMGDRDRCLAAGFDGYISKPIVDIEAFLTEVASYLSGHTSRRSA